MRGQNAEKLFVRERFLIKQAIKNSAEEKNRHFKGQTVLEPGITCTTYLISNRICISHLNTDNEIFSCQRALLGISGGPFGFLRRGSRRLKKKLQVYLYINVKKIHLHFHKFDNQSLFVAGEGTRALLGLGKERRPDSGEPRKPTQVV